MPPAFDSSGGGGVLTITTFFTNDSLCPPSVMMASLQRGTGKGGPQAPAVRGTGVPARLRRLPRAQSLVDDCWRLVRPAEGGNSALRPAQEFG